MPATSRWWPPRSAPPLCRNRPERACAACHRRIDPFGFALENYDAVGRSCQTGNLLTGAHLASSGEIRSGVSMDQVLANRLRGETKVPSLVLGCEPSIAALHKNYSMIYSSHISWASATTPVPLELYPALAFDRLFRDEASRADKSVLDAVRADAAGVSRADARRLDEYLASVREVERRIDNAGRERRLQGWRPTLAKPDRPRPADGLPQGIDQHMRLMCDILVLAFRTDTTRVCTLKLYSDYLSLRFLHLLGQLDDSVPVEHDDREPQQRLAAGSAARPRGQSDQDRARARLPRQAEPQDVQPVLVTAGQGRGAARLVRRLAGTPGGDSGRRRGRGGASARPKNPAPRERTSARPHFLHYRLAAAVRTAPRPRRGAYLTEGCHATTYPAVRTRQHGRRAARLDRLHGRGARCAIPRRGVLERPA